MLIEWLREVEAQLRERAVQQQRTAARCFKGVRCRRRHRHLEQSVRDTSAQFARQQTDEWARAHTALREAEALMDLAAAAFAFFECPVRPDDLPDPLPFLADTDVR
jgi:hypothetical protein